MAVSFFTVKNNCISKLAVELTSSDVQMTLQDASNFPSVYPYHVVVNNSEIVEVTNKNGNILTISRGVESSPVASSVAAGKKVALNLTAEYISQIQDVVNVLVDYSINVSNVSANFTVNNNGVINRNIFVDCTTGNKVITLPSTANASAGTNFFIKKTDNTLNTATVTPVNGQKIDGVATYVLELEDEFVSITSDGTNWQVVGE